MGTILWSASADKNIIGPSTGSSMMAAFGRPIIAMGQHTRGGDDSWFSANRHHGVWPPTPPPLKRRRQQLGAMDQPP
jgi:hypothetical protein